MSIWQWSSIWVTIGVSVWVDCWHSAVVDCWSGNVLLWISVVISQRCCNNCCWDVLNDFLDNRCWDVFLLDSMSVDWLNNLGIWVDHWWAVMWHSCWDVWHDGANMVDSWCLDNWDMRLNDVLILSMIFDWWNQSSECSWENTRKHHQFIHYFLNC